MTQTLQQYSHRIDGWVDRVRALADQVAQWASAQGWRVQREDVEIDEERVGKYHVPAVRAFLPTGELFLNPKSLNIRGADGRVDLSVYPYMSRVKLLLIAGDWQIMTDSNIPLRQPWCRETFLQIVSDMLH
jgi:hypothetical protein